MLGKMWFQFLIITLVHSWQEYKMVQMMWKTAWQFLKKLKIKLPYDSTIPLLGIGTKALKAGSQREICTPMLIAALFKIAKRYRQPKYPLMDKWINKCGIYMYTQ